MTAPSFKFNQSTVIGGRSFPGGVETPFVPAPNRILIDSRFSLAARLFCVWCYGKDSDWVFVKKNICFELGISEQQRRTIFKELEALGVLKTEHIRVDVGGVDEKNKKKKVSEWTLMLNFTIFDGLVDLERRKEERGEKDLSTKNENQQLARSVDINRSREGLKSTDHRVVEINRSKQKQIIKEKNKQQVVVLNQNPVAQEIAAILVEKGASIKNRAAYISGILQNKAAAATGVDLEAEKKQATARFVCEQNLARQGKVYGPDGLLFQVRRGDVGLFRDVHDRLHLQQKSASIWFAIKNGELNFVAG